MLPLSVGGVYGQGPAPEVLAPVEVPDDGDLAQHHTALGYWEAAGGPQQVGAAPRPGKVAFLHPDGPRCQHCYNGLPVPGLTRVGRGVR